MDLSVPHYVQRNIAVAAACDIINRHGWSSLGVDRIDEAFGAIESGLYEDSDKLCLKYEYRDEMHVLYYDWRNYQ